MFETKFLSSTKETKEKDLIVNKMRESFLNHKNIQNMLALALLAMVICLFQLSYMRYVAPPQMGWWQYYGWRVASGDLLYKDIYLFLQPYFAWLMGGLYCLFGNHFFSYQILGLGLRIIEAALVFLLLRRFLSAPESFLFAFFGVVFTAGYLADFCFDCNQFLRFLVVVTAYLAVRAWEAPNKKQRLLFLLLVGFICGLHTMSKQTGLVVFCGVVLGLFVVFWKTETLKKSSFYLLLIIVGFLVACIPGYLYLIYTHSFDAYLKCMSVAVNSKGGVANLTTWLFSYMFHWQEFAAAVLFFLFYFLHKNEQSYDRLTGKIGEETYHYAVILFVVTEIVFLINRMNNLGLFTAVTLSLFIKGIAGCVALGGLLWIVWFLWKRKKRAAFKFFLSRDTVLLLIVFVLLSVVLVLIKNYNYVVKMTLFESNIPAQMIRILVNISFWSALLLFITQTVELVRTKTVTPSVSFYIYFGVALLMPLTSLLSSAVEELYMLMMFPPLLLLASKMDTKLPAVKHGLTFILCVSLLFFVITGKQVEPYQWYGWTVPSITDPYVEHCDSTVNGLQGYCLSVDDEKAYAKIVSLIKENTTSNDTVYQFPSMMLFNVLTERQTGTYAPVHYFDVCSDEIASADAKRLAKDPPKMVIWCELGEASWKFHEDYFREGKRSGQRDIQAFYENYVKSNYTLAYQYESLYVWVRND